MDPKMTPKWNQNAPKTGPRTSPKIWPVLGAILGAPGDPFGSLLGSILGSFLLPFSNRFFIDFLWLPGAILDSILAWFSGRFEVKNVWKILWNFWCGSVMHFGSPGRPQEVKNLDFHWSVVQNRGSTFSRPNASGIAFWSKKCAKTEVQSDGKS